MDEALLRQIIRQLKFLNFWIAFFGVITITTLAITGLVLFKIATVANNSIKKLDSFQQQTSKTLNVKQQLCSDVNLSSLLNSQTSFCK